MVVLAVAQRLAGCNYCRQRNSQSPLIAKRKSRSDIGSGTTLTIKPISCGYKPSFAIHGGEPPVSEAIGGWPLLSGLGFIVRNQ